MNKNVVGRLTVCLLDYNRPKESARCLDSIYRHLFLPDDQWQLLYLSNGGNQSHAHQWYNSGYIDTLILNRVNVGCGIAMRQMVQAALTEWVLLLQTDQYMIKTFSQLDFAHMVQTLEHPNGQSILYYDLAGNQGNGRYSERAQLINRRRYLDIPGFDDIIGGPGPYAQSKWTEQHIQEYMRANSLSFVSDESTRFFADNGKWSERDYGAEYGFAKTRHSTDEKRLFILSPFSKRADGFPNLNLTDEEWEQVLAGKWPVEGKVPEADKAHSFVVWPE